MAEGQGIVDRKLLKLTLIVKRGEAEEVGVHDGRRRGAEARFPRRNGVFRAGEI